MQTEAEKRAVKKYHEKFDDIKIRVPKGKREEYKKFAETQGKSLNALIIDLIEDEIAFYESEDE